MAIFEHKSTTPEPLILTVPGLSNSGPNHWQTAWEQERDDCQRVELGMWDNPHRNTWVNQLNFAIALADRPVVLVAHSLGCLTVAWWALLEAPRSADTVIGALLVAPCEVDHGPVDPRLTKFAPLPQRELPFPSVLVASRDDPYMAYGRAVKLARTWGSWLVDAGHEGHINADSGLGSWPFGKSLLGKLLRGGLDEAFGAAAAQPSSDSQPSLANR